jgi:hypothetical protein
VTDRLCEPKPEACPADSILRDIINHSQQCDLFDIFVKRPPVALDYQLGFAIAFFAYQDETYT